MSGVLVSVRLDAEAVAEIDGRVGSRGRSGFIRDAVAAALKPVANVPCARAAVREPAVPVRRALAVGEKIGIERRRVLAAAEQERSDKMKLLLETVRRRAMTARDASLELGWPEILTAKVADKLFAAGLVHFPRGAGVMEAK
jgi:Arc/MetJ-type ribon-helix-helix transcriptional regulator